MSDVAPETLPNPRRKGGTRFPRYKLEHALVWARKLVSKTHLTPVPRDIVFASVVESKGSTGEVKISALKQYGLLEGDSKAYAATRLAKAITHAPEEELAKLYVEAALSPDIFKKLYDTFHGDEVAYSRLRQRAADLQVHPDETARCIDTYVSALLTAGLASESGDKVAHLTAAASDLNSGDQAKAEEVKLDSEASLEEPDLIESDEAAAGDEVAAVDSRLPRAIFNVNISLDSSLDTEKLERQLKLLKRFGAI